MSNSRLEKFIYAICSMEVSDLPAPLSRIEILWNCLITGETPDFEPQSRNEQYLMAMLGLYELENLPTPMSRGEKLLYKIAMGETDLSDIPAYLSRYEELLGYLAENGGVGDFEYILQTLNQRLSTLYSTKERPMKQAVIKGDTLVNELPRPSLKNTMTNVGSQKLNHGYDNGKTLTNLLSNDKIVFRTAPTDSWSTSSSEPYPTRCLARIENIKSNTRYIVKLPSSETKQIFIRFWNSTANAKNGNTGWINVNSIFTTLNDTAKIAISFRISENNEEYTDISQCSDILLLEYQDGMENWDIPYFEGTKTFSATPNVIDGEFKQAVVKGQTLVNLFNGDAIAYGSATNTSSIAGFNKNTNTAHFLTNANAPSPYNYSYLSVYGGDINGVARYLKNDTDYTILWYLEKILDADDSKTAITIGASSSQYGSPILYNKSVNIKNGKMLYHTQASYDSDVVRLMGIKLMNLSNDIEYKGKFVILEGDYTNIDIPYFEGMQSVQLSEVTTTGKNLFDGKLKHGEIAGGVDNTDTKYVKSVNYISIEPDTYYSLTCGDGYNSTSGRVIVWYDSNKNYISHVNHYGVSPSNACFARLRTRKDDSTAIPKAELSTIQAQLEKGKVATLYEPYHSNTLTLAEPVNLRKVGDVEDEFDALTGQVTERVGEIVLDGSDDELWETDLSNPNNYKFLIELPNINCNATSGMITEIVISDKFPSANNGDSSVGKDIESICINGWANRKLNLAISKTKLTDMSVNSLREYLSQNPFTVQYQLATPTTKTVNTTITNQDGVTQTKLHSFNDGYLSVSSQGLLPSAVNYEVPTNNSYYLPDMLTLDAQYTSRGSADCNATIDGKLLALGKNRIFTTPSTLTNRLMVLDTPVDDLMFIKGDHTAKDFGYFEGIKSVVLSNKMPVLTTTGKNLFALPSTNEMTDGTIGKYIKLKLKPNTNYTYNVRLDKKGNTNSRDFYGWISSEINGNFNGNSLFHWNMNKGYSETFNTGDDNWYLHIHGEKDGEDYREYLLDFQIEQGSTATSYEPYKSNILMANEEVELRGIGDVRDTLDCLTSEVVQNIGEIMLNGSNYDFSINNNTDTIYLIFNTQSLGIKKAGLCVCDKLPYKIGSEDMEHMRINADGNIVLWFNKSKFQEINKSFIQTYLFQNPVRVQYELAEKSIKTVDLTTVDQDGQPTKLKTFNDITYVEMNADNIIPSVNVEVATKISETLSTIEPQQNDISNTQNELGQTIDEQTENTDAAMLATTEIYEQTL